MFVCTRVVVVHSGPEKLFNFSFSCWWLRSWISRKLNDRQPDWQTGFDGELWTVMVVLFCVNVVSSFVSR